VQKVRGFDDTASQSDDIAILKFKVGRIGEFNPTVFGSVSKAAELTRVGGFRVANHENAPLGESDIPRTTGPSHHRARG
jgi:hypothetical protein